MAFGVLAAVVSGGCLPALFILFGQITNTFVYNDIINSITNESLPSFIATNPAWEIYENETVET